VSAQRLIVGLGNPGAGYTMTRHNAGYLVLDQIAHDLNMRFREGKYVNGYLASASAEGMKITLLKPLTYMNSSGEAVKRCLEEIGASVSDMLVIVDDVYIPFGSLRLREQGSSGGHKGLESIKEHLQTQEYVRLKFGVGNEALTESELADFVLGPFTDAEQKLLPKLQKCSAEIAIAWAARGIGAARQELSKQIALLKT
jgi:PTH1 family peptidyl-tRNA hydrolase